MNGLPIPLKDKYRGSFKVISSYKKGKNGGSGGGGGELRFRAFPRIHFSSQEAFKYSSTSRGGFHGAEIIIGQ